MSKIDHVLGHKITYRGPVDPNVTELNLIPIKAVSIGPTSLEIDQDFHYKQWMLSFRNVEGFFMPGCGGLAFVVRCPVLEALYFYTKESFLAAVADKDRIVGTIESSESPPGD